MFAAKVYKFSQSFGVKMRKRACLLAFFFIVGLGFSFPASAQKSRYLPSRLLTAKLIYFQDETGFPAVGPPASTL